MSNDYICMSHSRQIRTLYEKVHYFKACSSHTCSDTEKRFSDSTDMHIMNLKLLNIFNYEERRL